MIDAQHILDDTDPKLNINPNITVDSNSVKMESVFCTSENSEIGKCWTRADDIRDFENRRSYVSPVSLNGE